MTIDVIVPASSQRSYDNFHFAPMVHHDGILLLSGVIGTNEKGRVPESQEDEFHNAWKAIGALLGEVGAEYSDILELTSYHVGLQQSVGAFVKVKDAYVQAPYPAWTAIGITELAIPGATVEIRVTARKP